MNFLSSIGGYFQSNESAVQSQDSPPQSNASSSNRFSIDFYERDNEGIDNFKCSLTINEAEKMYVRQELLRYVSKTKRYKDSDQGITIHIDGLRMYTRSTIPFLLLLVTRKMYCSHRQQL